VADRNGRWEVCSRGNDLVDIKRVEGPTVRVGFRGPRLWILIMGSIPSRGSRR
jgi:hypothetical protein